MNTRIAAGIIVVVTSTTGPAIAQEKPVVSNDLFVDYQATPPTLSGLANLADLVVVGSIGSIRNIVMSDRGYSNAHTEIGLKVTTVIKGNGVTPGGAVSILRSGGDVDLGDKVRRSVERGFPPFRSGDQYLLFLRWNGALLKYEVLYGPNGAFRIAGDAIQAIGLSPVSRQHNGWSMTDIVRELTQGIAR